MADDTSTPEGAVELGKALDQVLLDFEAQHGQLLRRVCAVPDALASLREVVVCTFLGHTLEQLRRLRGRAKAERVVQILLDGQEAIDRALPRGTLQ
jgi:hypothetical protein